MIPFFYYSIYFLKIITIYDRWFTFSKTQKQIVSPKDKNEVKNMKKLMFIITLIIGAFLISFSPVEAVSTNRKRENLFCLVGKL